MWPNLKHGAESRPPEPEDKEGIPNTTSWHWRALRPSCVVICWYTPLYPAARSPARTAHVTWDARREPVSTVSSLAIIHDNFWLSVWPGRTRAIVSSWPCPPPLLPSTSPLPHANLTWARWCHFRFLTHPHPNSTHWFTTSFLWRKVPESGARSVTPTPTPVPPPTPSPFPT